MLCHGVPHRARTLRRHCPAPASSPLQDVSCSGTGSRSIPRPVRPPGQASDTEGPWGVLPGRTARSQPPPRSQPLLLLQGAEPQVPSASACPCLCLICLILGCFIGKPTKYQTYSYSARDAQHRPGEMLPAPSREQGGSARGPSAPLPAPLAHPLAAAIKPVCPRRPPVGPRRGSRELPSPGAGGGLGWRQGQRSPPVPPLTPEMIPGQRRVAPCPPLAPPPGVIYGSRGTEVQWMLGTLRGHCARGAGSCHRGGSLSAGSPGADPQNLSPGGSSGAPQWDIPTWAVGVSELA